MTLSGTSYFSWTPFRILETMGLSISFFFFFAYRQASFFYSIAPCLLSIKDLGDMCVGHGWSIYFGRPYLWIG
jgi:hypothetical protein